MYRQFIYQIKNVMSTSQIRNALHLKIEQLDESFLRVMYAMTETYLKEKADADLEKEVENVPPNASWKPLTEAELMERLAASAAEYDKGNYLTIEELEKESEQW